MAGRPDRHRLQRRAQVDEVGSFEELITRVRPEGQDHPAQRDARHDGLHAQDHRRRPGGLRRRRLGRRDRPARGGNRRRAGAPVRRQQLPAAALAGQPARLRGVVGRRDPGRRSTTRTSSSWCRRRACQPLERQHDGAQQGRPTRPTPKPGSTSTTSPRSRRSSPPWVNYICPVQGAREAMHEIDPVPCREPTDLPRRRDAREHLRLHDARRRASNSSTKESGRMSSQQVRGGSARPRGSVVRRPAAAPASPSVRRLHRGPRARPRRAARLVLRAARAVRAAARPRPCGWSRGSRPRRRARSRWPDKDITAAKPYRRPVNTVFQNYALFPHLDIYENVAFGLRRRKVR